ncbi:hypothetical protein PMIN01_01955 [Paraphaeosphaeria minitans]|uniref:Uncharacterized protein n=1 Tax=Paraphaeosphaeria minitans TaxID=565426 RepID=A0A9P6GQ25_9PLEO|nr:hypothetical protein PMIN01_01955 [Paraphaeosphaeria minitans]
MSLGTVLTIEKTTGHEARNARRSCQRRQRGLSLSNPRSLSEACSTCCVAQALTMVPWFSVRRISRFPWMKLSLGLDALTGASFSGRDLSLSQQSLSRAFFGTEPRVKRKVSKRELRRMAKEFDDVVSSITITPTPCKVPTVMQEMVGKA